jgi:hypothetical protein
MGQLTNQYVSSSYQGLLKMTDSTQGLTNTLQTIQTGDGDNSPLQMSFTEVNISGSFFINNVPITNGTNGTSGTSGVAGSSGTSGSSGSNGSSGTSGQSGSSGSAGSDGSSGTSGTSGSNGSSGTSGVDGSSGTSGSNGSDGSSGTSGVAGSSGTSGTSFESPYTGDIIVTGSIDITGQFLVNGVPVTGSGGGGDRNGLITTGSVTDTQQITGSLILGNTVISGSLVGNTINRGFIKITSEAAVSGTLQLNVTSSNAVSQSNLLFVPAAPSAVVASQLTGSIVISGSNNILFQTARTQSPTQTANGIYGYIGGSNNIISTIPLFTTASLTQRPVMNNNQLNGLLSIGLITSSLNSSTNNNVIYGGVTLASQSGSFAYQNNFNNSQVTLNQNTNPLTGSGTAGNTFISQNNFGGGITLNAVSSSIQATGNITFGGGTFVTNSYFQTGSNSFVNIQANILGGSNNHVQFGGNPQTNIARSFSTNILGGTNNIVNMDATGSNTNMFSTLIYGQSLSINPKEQIDGMAVLGKYNKPVTGSTIFVVGNGTGTGDRRNAIEVTTNNQTLISGSVNISGSLQVNGLTPLIGTAGLITTGSYNGLQSMSSSLLVANTSNAGHPYLLQAQAFDFTNNALSVTGRTNITGSLIVNGTTITAVDRNGLITTGSAGQTQNITGSLIVSSSAVTIIAGPGNPTNTLDIQSGSMRMSDISGSIRIATANNQPQLFFNPTRKVGFFLGQSNMDQVNTQFGITDDSTDNYTMGGNFNNFRTGSNNLMLGVQSISIRSGSNNIILARDTNYNTGSNNLMLGRGPLGVNECQEYFNLQLPNGGTPIMFKSGSAALTLNSNTTISGSLNVTDKINNLKIWTGSLNSNSIGIGNSTLNSQTGSSLNNIAIGGGALQTNVTGSGIVAIGDSALRDSVAGFNLALGSSALQANTTGQYNIGIGQSSGQANTIGEKNISIGWNSFVNNTTGSTNTAIGAQSLQNNISGSGNVAIGNSAGYYSTSSNEFFVGNDNYGGVNTERSGSLFWGQFNSTTANQTLQINAQTSVRNNLVVSGSLTVGGNLQFNVGDFYSTQTQTLAAGVSGSVTYNNTGTSFGVTLASSSQLTIANAGVYSITFSAQIKGDGGQDTVYMWLKKNGTNVADTATKLVAKNNEEDVMTVEYIVQAAASDYYEIAWQNLNGDGDLLYEAASGNIPAIPSIITSVKQVR